VKTFKSGSFSNQTGDATINIGKIPTSEQFFIIFIATRSSYENSVLSVCLYVCLSNTWIVTKRGKKICPEFYTIRKII